MGSDRSRFAVFILSHGRPDNVITYDVLRRSGYTGRVYLIIDNEDERGDEYRAQFGASNVIEFDKAAVAATMDEADTTNDRRAVVYARNASYGIAKDLGLDYFLQLDDDYRLFKHRWVSGDFAPNAHVRSMDAVVDAMLTFLDDTGAASVAFSQAGDHLSGTYRELRLGLLRKAMNSYFCRTDRPVEFLGRINDDVNAYVVHGSRGALFFTIMGIQIDPFMTQASAGGMTEVYRESGTYLKSFYSVMMAPSCVTVRTMGSTHKRIHHHVRWDCAVPKILNERHRKA